MISITSLIIKSAQPFEKIHIFYKILGLLQWDGSPFVKGKYFCGGGFRPRPKLPRPWTGPVLRLNATVEKPWRFNHKKYY